MNCLDHFKNHNQKLIKNCFSFLLTCKIVWTDNSYTAEYSLVWSYDHLIIFKKSPKRTLTGIIVRRHYIFFTWPDQSTFLYQWSLFKRHKAIMIIHYKQNKQDVRLEIKYWQQSGKFAKDEWAFPGLLCSSACQNKQQNTHKQHTSASSWFVFFFGGGVDDLKHTWG